MIDISVIIVNYNTSELLTECLDSLYEHSKQISFETIIVDNASKDFKTADFEKKYKNLKILVNKTNLGFAAANNQGLKLALGKYVLFLNNDTKLLSNILKSVYDFAENFSNPIFVGCQLLNKDFSKQESVVEFPSVWNGFTENFFLYKLFPKSKFLNKYYQNELTWKEPIEVDVIRGAFMFCPTEIINKLNGFDARFFFYSEETDLCYRFKQMNGKIIFLPDQQIIHYGGVASDKNLWFKYKNQTIGKIQFYQKHFKGYKFLSVLIIHFIGLFLRGILNSIAGIILLKKGLLKKGLYFLKQMFVYPKNVFYDR